MNQAIEILQRAARILHDFPVREQTELAACDVDKAIELIEAAVRRSRVISPESTKGLAIWGYVCSMNTTLRAHKSDRFMTADVIHWLDGLIGIFNRITPDSPGSVSSLKDNQL